MANNDPISGSGAGIITPGVQGFGGAPFEDRTIQKKTQNPTPPAAPSAADQVRAVQQQLNGMGAHLIVDGVLGPMTQAAMAQYGVDINGNHVAPAATPAAPAPAPAPAAAAPAVPTAPAASPQDIETQVRTKYGYLGAILLDNPEIHNLLVQAVQQGWDAATVEGSLMSTNYWRTTSAPVRQWDTLNGTDPQEAQAQILGKKADISQEAAKLGIPIADDRLTQMATDALKYGIDATGLQQMIGNEFHYQPGAQTGSVGTAEVDLKQMAGSYFVPLSDQTLSQWEGQIAQGRGTAQDYQNQIIQMAKGAYKAPWIQTALDSGQTMTQIADPYRQQAAKDLEIDPAAIDFTQPKWQRALTQQDKDGNPVGMDLASWQYTVRSDPSYGFSRTSTARQMAYDAVANLEQGLGKIAR